MTLSFVRIHLPSVISLLWKEKKTKSRVERREKKIQRLKKVEREREQDCCR